MHQILPFNWSFTELDQYNGILQNYSRKNNPEVSIFLCAKFLRCIFFLYVHSNFCPPTKVHHGNTYLLNKNPWKILGVPISNCVQFLQKCTGEYMDLLQCAIALAMKYKTGNE